MNWLLIVTTTLFAHGSPDPTIVTFTDFETKSRCEQMANWINNTYSKKTSTGKLQCNARNRTCAQCVKKE